MKFLIEEDNFFKERNFNLIISVMEKLGLDYEIVSIPAFTENITKRIKNNKEDGHDDFIPYETEEKNVYCIGSNKFAHIAKERNWYPGSLFNDNHDFNVYSKFYKEHLLNYDYQCFKFGDKLPVNTPTLFFCRPCGDTKLFTGGVYMEDSWYEHVAHIKNNLPRDPNDELVMMCPLKNIAYETRCWVINGQVITMSEYRRGNYTVYKNVDDNLFLKDQVQKLINIYQPAQAFVMDVCETIEEPGVLKIVEINCINASGFYYGNIPKMINAVIELFDISYSTNNF